MTIVYNRKSTHGARIAELPRPDSYRIYLDKS